MKGELEFLDISKKTGLSVTLLKEIIKVISKYTSVEKQLFLVPEVGETLKKRRILIFVFLEMK